MCLSNKLWGINQFSLVADVDENNYELGALKVQMGQFSTTADPKNISLGKTIEILGDSGKWYHKKILIAEVRKIAKLLLIMTVTNARGIIAGNETNYKLFKKNTAKNRLDIIINITISDYM